MDRLISYILHNGLPALFLVIFLEYACFPISSEVILPFCGFISKINSVSFPVIFLISVIAGVLGTLVCYGIGYILGYKLINAISGRFPTMEGKLNRSFIFFNKYGSFAVCLGRMIPLVRTYISFVAGITKMNFLRYTVFSALGISLWNFVLIWLGFKLGDNIDIISKWYNTYKHYLIPFLIITITATVYISKKKHFQYK